MPTPIWNPANCPYSPIFQHAGTRGRHARTKTALFRFRLQSVESVCADRTIAMAKGGDKRRLEQNAAHLRKLRLLIAAANVREAACRRASRLPVGRPAQQLPEPTSGFGGGPPRSLPCLCSAQVAFAVVRLVLKRSSAGKLLYVAFASTAAVTAVCYRSISSALCERAACLPG